MIYCRVGDSNVNTSKVQDKLNEVYDVYKDGSKYEPLVVDGIFGGKTLAMVYKFQRDNLINVDGIVGTNTWNKLFDTDGVKDYIYKLRNNVYKFPIMLKDYNALMEIFGTPWLDPNWWAENCARISTPPELIHVFPKNRVYSHRIMEKPLTHALSLIVNRGLMYELHSYHGSFNVRKIRGRNQWSIHSWALAIDLDAKQNPLGHKPTMHASVVKCFKEAGFEWGGDWTRPDGMHFQIIKLLSYA